MHNKKNTHFRTDSKNGTSSYAQLDHEFAYYLRKIPDSAAFTKDQKKHAQQLWNAGVVMFDFDGRPLMGEVRGGDLILNLPGQ